MVYTFLLNIAVFCYLVFYLPQVWRNRQDDKLIALHLGWHALLLVAATCDVFYGFGVVHQWQYRLVACVMLGVLLIQHAQLMRIAKNNPKKYRQLIFIALMAVALMAMLAFSWGYATHHVFLFFAVGWVERISYWSYMLPQIHGQWQDIDKVKAMSPVALFIGFFALVLDIVCAWHFNWGPSSRYGAPVAVLIHACVIWQWWRYRLQRLVNN